MNALDYHKLAVKMLTARGWQCENEVESELASGGQGYIDIVARKGWKVAAIELDWRSPREKSIHKLTRYRATRRFVVLRNPFKFITYRAGTVVVLPGLDALIEQLK